MDIDDWILKLKLKEKEEKEIYHKLLKIKEKFKIS